MRKFSSRLMLLGLAFCIGSLQAVRASDDESEDTLLEIKAPVQAVDCTVVPPTVTVLGITIPVPTDVSSSSSSRRKGADDNGSDDDTVACSSLVVGQIVEIKFASATAPLTASRLESTGSTDTKVQGRIDAIDPSAQTITVLGITIQVAGARIDGSSDTDDNSSTDDNSLDSVLTFSQLAVGQFVEARLNVAVLPSLVATEVEVRNFTNQVGLTFDDKDDSLDNDDDAIEIEIEHTYVVLEPKPTGTGMRRVKKVITYRYTANGATTLPGFPTGVAKVNAVRTSDGATAKKSIRVKGGQTTSGILKLKPFRSARPLSF